MDTSVPFREVLWNIPKYSIMYVIMVIAFAIASYGIYRRFRLMRLGEPVSRSDHRWERFKGMFTRSILQTSLARVPSTLMRHLGMYGGMLVMLVATVASMLTFRFNLPLMQGAWYKYFMSLIVDLAGLLFCVSMVWAIIRRSINRKIPTKPKDVFVLVLMFAVGCTGFFVEGLRIYATNDPWALWSPVGYACSLLFQGMDIHSAEIAHRICWWGHMGLAFVLLAYWFYSKLAHVLLIPLATYRRSLESHGVVPVINLEDEDIENIGVGHIEDFNRKDLLDFEACVRCRKCEEVCPVYQAGGKLSPMRMMIALDDHLMEQGEVIWKARKASKADGDGEDAATEGDAGTVAVELVGNVVPAEALWSCTTCGACWEVCPGSMEQVTKFERMRTYEVSMNSAFPKELTPVFRGIERNGNPWGLGWQTRMSWAKGLDVPTLDDNPDAEYLFWPGCSGAFDSRNQKVAQALVALLNRAGVNYAVLGKAEKCCGDAARRLGNEFAYYQLAQENIETMNAYGVKKIITQCPHCFNTLVNDYAQLGGKYEVIHHTDFLLDLVKQQRLPIRGNGKTVTYQDPCYLGRYAKDFAAPRNLLDACGCSIAEMKQRERLSVCCGGGGGQMWLESSEASENRPNTMRLEQALETGAGCIATACPFCLGMLQDAASSQGCEWEIKDVAELLLEALEE